MLKKSKKLTALLVAAASICSIIPVSANAAERLGTKEGTLETAISFKDGKYIYKGYQSDEDDNAIYYNNGETEKQLNDLDDADIISKYGEKYVYVKDSDDEFFVNLSNGQIEDDEELEDKAKDVNTKLKNALKKTDRYGKIDGVTLDENNILDSNNFSKIWYSYFAVPEDKADGKDDVIWDYEQGKEGLYGFTNEEGKYIDISSTANMYVYSSKRGKMVKVDEFNKEDSDSDIEIYLSQSPQLLTQDDDYLYVMSLININDMNDQSNRNGMYIQKISKAQGDQKDDAYLPKTVESYELSYHQYDCDDANDLIDSTLGDREYSVPKFAAKDGYIYMIQVNSNGYDAVISNYDDDDFDYYERFNNADKMKVTKIKLKKEKVNSENPEITSKLDVQLVEKDDDEEQDIARGFDSISIDVDGNIWALDKGSIIKFDDLQPNELYRCDNSLTNLDVYDSNNLIAWDGTEDGDVFTVLQAGNKALDYDAEQPEKQPEQTTEPAVEIKSGWEKNSDGTWSYYKDNVMVKGQWVQDGNWYYLSADGIMARGWLLDKGNWYYLDQSGAMLTGWLQDTDGSWYYLSPESGAMLTSTTVDGYVLGADGIWIK